MMASNRPTIAANAPGGAPFASRTISDSTTPCRFGVGEKRQERPSRLGCAPGAAAGIAIRPAFSFSSASASPPPAISA